jgi:hypothetical protein
MEAPPTTTPVPPCCTELAFSIDEATKPVLFACGCAETLGAGTGLGTEGMFCTTSVFLLAFRNLGHTVVRIADLVS